MNPSWKTSPRQGGLGWPGPRPVTAFFSCLYPSYTERHVVGKPGGSFNFPVSTPHPEPCFLEHRFTEVASLFRPSSLRFLIRCAATSKEAASWKWRSSLPGLPKKAGRPRAGGLKDGEGTGGAKRARHSHVWSWQLGTNLGLGPGPCLSSALSQLNTVGFTNFADSAHP